MRKILDIVKQCHGDNFEVIIRENGDREYRTWQGMRISYEGNIEKVGVNYHREVIVTDANDENFRIEEIPEKEFDELWFVEDIDRFEKYHNVSGVRELLGLPSEEFSERLAAKVVGLEEFEKKGKKRI